MGKLKISVIVPVYNVEKYLKECIEGVLEQSYKEFELILVDDGSTDCSGDICESYARKDERIKVIHKINGGLSDARNQGLLYATGDYISFLDSDDFWDDKEALQRIVNRLLEYRTDVLNYSYKKYYETSNEKKAQFENIKAMSNIEDTLQKQLEYIVGKSLYIASACNKMIKRELFQDDMWFEKGKLSEDIVWCAKLLNEANSMDFVCENFYCYRQREGSITHTIGEKACQDLENNILGCLKICELCDKLRKKYLLEYTAYQLGTFFVVQAIAGKCSDKYVKNLSKYKWLLKYHANNRKIKYLYWGTKIFGFTLLCKIIRCSPRYR